MKFSNIRIYRQTGTQTGRQEKKNPRAKRESKPVQGVKENCPWGPPWWCGG